MMRFRASLFAACVALLVTAPLTVQAQNPEAPEKAPARTARLQGQVIAHDTGTPIANAVVTLLGLETEVTTGPTGRFDFGKLEPGPYILQAKAIGYEPYTVRAELAESASLDLVFRMRLVTIQLGDMIVTAKPKVNRFTERMAESGGFGKFITREQIEARKTPFICDLLRGQVGLRITGGNAAGCSVRVARAQGVSVQNSDCPPGFFLDGVRVDISLLEANGIPTGNIEGIEIYRSSAETPGEFNAFNACGVVAIWTRQS